MTFTTQNAKDSIMYAEPVSLYDKDYQLETGKILPRALICELLRDYVEARCSERMGSLDIDTERDIEAAYTFQCHEIATLLLAKVRSQVKRQSLYVTDKYELKDYFYAVLQQAVLVEDWKADAEVYGTGIFETEIRKLDTSRPNLRMDAPEYRAGKTVTRKVYIASRKALGKRMLRDHAKERSTQRVRRVKSVRLDHVEPMYRHYIIDSKKVGCMIAPAI